MGAASGDLSAARRRGGPPRADVGVEERRRAHRQPETRRGARWTVRRPTAGLARVGWCSSSRRAGVCGCWARLTWDLAIDGHPGSSVSRRGRLPRLPPSARAPPLGPGRPCEQRQQQRRRARWCSCSAGARAARSFWQHLAAPRRRRGPLRAISALPRVTRRRSGAAHSAAKPWTATRRPRRSALARPSPVRSCTRENQLTSKV